MPAGNLAKRSHGGGPARVVARKPRPPTDGYDTVKVLHQVWVMAGQPRGKCPAEAMGATVANMEVHVGSGAFGTARVRCSPQVHEQLLARSAATIDWLLAPSKLSMYPDGKSRTRSRRNQYTLRGTAFSMMVYQVAWGCPYVLRQGFGADFFKVY